MGLDTATFWIALGQIILFNLLLSGDNAVVIALAARSLPAEHQRKAIFWGSGAAVVMRILLTAVALEALQLPYLQLIGSALLFWIAVKLLVPEQDEDDDSSAIFRGSGLFAAVRTILIADLIMSLDNVIAVAAAANGSLLLLILGLGISIPLVIFGSTLLLKLMQRFPIVVTLGGALLGWVAGDTAIGDAAIRESVDASAHWLHIVAPAAGTALVVLIGKWLASRPPKRTETSITETGPNRSD